MIGLALIGWTFVVGFLGVLVLVLRDVSYWRLKGIPYLKSVPLIGIFFSSLVHKKSMPDQMIEIYNEMADAKYFGCMELGSPMLIVRDPEILKEIGVKNFNHFPNHRAFVADEFDPLLAKNIFALKDDRWRDMRTVLTPAFTANKMKHMFQLVSKCASDFVQYLSLHPELTDEMDLKDVYTRYTNDVIATAAFGVSVNSLKDRNNEFYENGKIATSFEGFLPMLKFICARIFPKLMRLLGFSFLPAKAEKFFHKLVEDTVKIRDEKGIVRPDIIHLLMQARNNDHGVKLTIDDIVAQAVIFFFAGFDTSARLMCFMSHILSHEPEIQARLRKEVDNMLIEQEGDITYESVTRMKYMDMVLSETLRLYPPQFFIDRVCKQPYELPPATEHSKSFRVPADMTILIPIIGLHRDPNYFPDPLNVDPERFSDENKNDIKPYTYLPFGFGPRKCIGDRFVLMETKILMIYLLRHFVFNPSPKTTRDIKFAADGSFGVPERGFWMKLKQREDSQRINDTCDKTM